MKGGKNHKFSWGRPWRVFLSKIRIIGKDTEGLEKSIPRRARTRSHDKDVSFSRNMKARVSEIG